MKKKLFSHFFYWALYFAFLWAYANARTSPTRPDWLMFLLSNILLVAVFYYSYFFTFPRFFVKSKFLGVTFFLLGLLSYYSIRYLLSYKLMPIFGRPLFDGNSISNYFANHTYYYFTYAIYALLFWYFKKTLTAEKEIREIQTSKLELQNRTLQLESENLNLQNAKLIAEYNHLKAQINPHFLFNTLNTFYSNTEPVLPETARGIMLLSDIMRYSLESGGTDGKVPLREELSQLNNYIELMQLRFEGQLNIQGNLFHNNQFQYPKDVQKWRILPHLMITMAENAFKHGNNREPFIMNLYLENDQLHFIFKNTIGMRKAETGTGIGIKNMKDRLGFAYNDNYRFETGINGYSYIAELYIIDKSVLPAENLNLAS